jgi:hypothetical protein
VLLYFKTPPMHTEVKNGSIRSVEHRLSVSVHRVAAALPFVDADPIVVDHQSFVDRPTLAASASDSKLLLAFAPLNLEVGIFHDLGAVVPGIASTEEETGKK